MLMDSFEVENFRSLKHLKLEKLARVNLLVGKNNVGKTSVLEGLWALRGIRSGEWLIGIEAERELEKEKADFRHLFYRFDGSKTIHLAIGYTTDTTAVSPVLKADFSLIRNHPTELTVRRATEFTTRRSTASALNINLSLPDSADLISVDFHRAEDGHMFFMPISPNAEKVLGNPLPLSRNYGTEFITTSIDRSLLSHKVETLKVAKQEEPLLRVLRQIDSRIQRIELVSSGQIYLDLGADFPTLMPLNLMGEGFQRLLDVVSAIAQMKDGVVLIDEIDNGLHYSVLRILWKGILQAAREYDVQIIVTTHSAEALRHLTWVLDEEEYASYRNDIAAYTLIRAKDDTVKSFRYDSEQLEFAMEHDMEVRN